MKDKINKNKLPSHIAVIMDGNGRWAKKRKGIRISGHQAGAKTVREITEASAELGIKYLTLYAFSTENWKRPSNEINSLMSLLAEHLDKDHKTLLDNNIRLNTIGNIDKLPPKVVKRLNSVKEKTRHLDRMTLNLALSYSGRWDIINACKNIATDVKNNKLDTDEITEDKFKEYLSTENMPDPELIIRTSGEYRLSNYLLFQMAYSEIYFTETLWPDFNKENLYKALLEYQKRERRFGKTSEQL